MANPITVVLGALAVRKITPQFNGRPLAGVFVDTDVLDAKVYRGDNQTVTYAPDVTWVSPFDTATASIRIAFVPALMDAAGITPGLYRVEVGVTPQTDGLRRVVHVGPVRFVGTSGADVPLPTIASWEDVLTYSSDIEKLEQYDVDQTQFIGQRAVARQAFVDEVCNRYYPRLGGSRQLSGSTITLSPPATIPVPTRAQLKAWLTDTVTPSRLVITSDIIEYNARKAAELIYQASVGTNNPYQQMAELQRKLAMIAMDRAVIEVDTKDTPDGVPAIRVDRDVTFLV